MEHVVRALCHERRSAGVSVHVIKIDEELEAAAATVVMPHPTTIAFLARERRDLEEQMAVVACFAAEIRTHDGGEGRAAEESV